MIQEGRVRTRRLWAVVSAFLLGVGAVSAEAPKGELTEGLETPEVQQWQAELAEARRLIEGVVAERGAEEASDIGAALKRAREAYKAALASVRPESAGPADGDLQAPAELRIQSGHADFLQEMVEPVYAATGDKDLASELQGRWMAIRQEVSAQWGRRVARQEKLQKDEWRDWRDARDTQWYYAAFLEAVGRERPEWESLVDLRLNRAYELQRLQRIDQAGLEWRSVLELQPNYTDAWERWGFHESHRGEIQQALRAMRIATGLESRKSREEQNPWIWTNFGDYVLLYRKDVKELSETEVSGAGELRASVPDEWGQPFDIEGALRSIRVFQDPLTRDDEIVEHALALYEEAKAAATANPAYSRFPFFKDHSDGLKMLYLYGPVWEEEAQPDFEETLGRLIEALESELEVARQEERPPWVVDRARVDLAKFYIEAERLEAAERQLDAIRTSKYRGRVKAYRQELREREADSP